MPKIKIDRKQIVPGTQVAFNLLSDAVWFDVIEVNGFRLTLKEAGRPNDREQYMDISVVAQVKKAQ